MVRFRRPEGFVGRNCCTSAELRCVLKRAKFFGVALREGGRFESERVGRELSSISTKFTFLSIEVESKAPIYSYVEGSREHLGSGSENLMIFRVEVEDLSASRSSEENWRDEGGNSTY